MTKLIPLALLACAACIPAQDKDGKADAERPTAAQAFATQTDAPTPDYRALMRQPKLTGETYTNRRATSRAPADAGAIGKVWIARLEARSALLGYGLGGKSDDSPVSQVDVGMTASEFDAWAKENGWRVPTHISWSFSPGMNLPRVSDEAKAGIRVWPASTTRTGIQNQALLGGKVELRDGCFWVGQFGEPADKLAWFHAEIGLDMDAEGYFILRSRVSGEALTRLGERMSWGGPASAIIDPAVEAELRAACGDAEIYIVGSPESSERFFIQYPHTQNPAPPPAKPTG